MTQRDPDRTKLLFLDLETCSLDPEDPILEIGMQVRNLRLEVVDTFHAVLARKIVRIHGRVFVGGLVLDQVVADMHTRSGLLVKCEGPDAMPEKSAFLAAARFAWKHWKDGGAILAGNGVWFDRGLIRAQMHELEAALHRKMIDCSGLLEVLRIFAGVDMPNTKSPHRALPDCDSAAERLRWCLGKIGVIPFGSVERVKNDMKAMGWS